MTNLSSLTSQFLENIRVVKNEHEVSRIINSTISELRLTGFTEEELRQLVDFAHSQLNSIDPVSVNDSQEWNMILHAKVELFRWTSRKS